MRDSHEQLRVDRELRRAFEGVARPGLSLHFGRVLRNRLREERRRRRRHEWCRVVMLGYWAAASVASLAVVMLIRWPETAFSLPVLRSLGAVIGMMLLAVWALLRYLPIGPLRLIQETMEAFRR